MGQPSFGWRERGVHRRNVAEVGECHWRLGGGRDQAPESRIRRIAAPGSCRGRSQRALGGSHSRETQKLLPGPCVSETDLPHRWPGRAGDGHDLHRRRFTSRSHLQQLRCRVRQLDQRLKRLQYRLDDPDGRRPGDVRRARRSADRPGHDVRGQPDRVRRTSCPRRPAGLVSICSSGSRR